MTDRTKELAAEFTKLMDARTFDEKTLAALATVDERFALLNDVVDGFIEIANQLTERVEALEKELAGYKSRFIPLR